MNRLALSSLLALAASCANVSSMVGLEAANPDVSKAQFERIKSLAGDWTGPSSGEHMGETVEVRYRVTGNGSAVEETLFPGTPHEMITMYHLDGARLMMTHYCSAGNQPRMVAEPGTTSNPNVMAIRFEFHDATNLASPNDGHMHRMEMTILDKDHLTSSWTYFKDGKPGEVAKFELTRKAATKTTYVFGAF